MAMTQLYKDNLEAGQAYEQFIVGKWLNFFTDPLNMNEGKWAQLQGENAAGVEIKLDRNHRRTGNLYIETKEKSNPENADYFPSGIWRDDNTQWFLVGDRHEAFIFDVLVLRKCQAESPHWLIWRETPTSQGWTMPKNDVPDHAQFHINFDTMKMSPYL